MASTTTISTGAIIALCLPQLAHTFMNVFFDAHVARFFMHDLCDANLSVLDDNAVRPGETTPCTCLTPTQLGFLSSLLGCAGLFVDVFVSHVLVESSGMMSALQIKAGNARQFGGSLALFMLSMALLHAVSHALLFNVMGGISSDAVLWWYLLWMLVKNMVPLQSLYGTLLQRYSTAVMWSRSRRDVGDTTTRDAFRSRLFGIKHQIDLIGSIAGGFIIPFLYHVLGIRFVPVRGMASAFGPTSWAVSYGFFAIFQALMLVVSYVIMIHQVLATTATLSHAEGKNTQDDSTSTAAAHSESSPFLASMKQSFQNAAFRNLLHLFMFESLRGLLWNGLYPFYLTYVLQLRDPAQYNMWNGIINTVGSIAASLCVPFWMHVTNRIGVHRCWILTYSLQIVVGGAVYFMVGKGQVVHFCVFVVLLNAIGRASGFLLDLIKARVFDYDQMLNQNVLQRREVSIESLWSLLPRYAGLPANAISFSIMTHWGKFAQDESDFNNENLIHTLCVQTCLLPAITSVICLLIMMRFPIDTDEKHGQVLDAIEKRKGNARVKSVWDPVTQEKRIYDTVRSNVALDRASQSFLKWEVNVWIEACSSSPKQKFRIWHWTWNFKPLLERMSAILWAGIGVVVAVWFASSSFQDGQDTSPLRTSLMWLSSTSFSISLVHLLRISPARALSDELNKIQREAEEEEIGSQKKQD